MRDPQYLGSSGSGSAGLDAAERGMEAALRRGLRPSPARTSARQVWYQAGLTAGRRRAVRWRAAAGLAGAAAAVLLARDLRGPLAPPPERVVYVEREPAPPMATPAAVTPTTATATGAPPFPAGRPPPADPAPTGASGYLRFCDAIARQDWTAVPAGPAGHGGGDVRPDPFRLAPEPGEAAEAPRRPTRPNAAG